MIQKKEKVIDLMRQTRPMLLPYWGNVAVEMKKTADAHDVVTKLDREVENFLRERLKEIDPDTAFVGEEFGGDGKLDTYWLCDPIDGTGLFMRGLPGCTAMLALIENNEVTFSVIYDFTTDELYHAEEGSGAYCNGAKIHVSNRAVKDAYISYEMHLDKKENVDVVVKLREKCNLIKYVCCGYEYAMVAAGKIEGRVVFDGYGHDWDYAPGALLVAEAGGVVANLGKHTYDFRDHNFIAANQNMFDDLTSGAGALFPIRE